MQLVVVTSSVVSPSHRNPSCFPKTSSGELVDPLGQCDLLTGCCIKKKRKRNNVLRWVRSNLNIAATENRKAKVGGWEYRRQESSFFPLSQNGNFTPEAYTSQQATGTTPATRTRAEKWPLQNWVLTRVLKSMYSQCGIMVCVSEKQQPRFKFSHRHET